MNKRKIMATNSVIVFDKVVKASQLNNLTSKFSGDVIITKKLVIDKKIDISCNLYVIGGIVRKYSISELDININGDLHCYGEIHCHNINVNGDFYSQDIIYSRNIKVGENFLCIGKLDAYGCKVIVAGDFECNDIIAGKVECLGKIRIKGSTSVATGIENGC